MRRSIVLVMGCLLAVAVVVAMPGCGGADTKQAKQYMQAGDDAVNKLNAQSSQWQSQATTALSSAGDPAANVASLEQVKASMAGISSAVSAAKAEYQKIKGLKGVDDYVRYAAIRVEALDLVQQLLDKANELFDKRVSMESSGDRSGADAAQQSFSEDVQSITSRITKLDEEAQKLQSEKNL